MFSRSSAVWNRDPIQMGETLDQKIDKAPDPGRKMQLLRIDDMDVSAGQTPSQYKSPAKVTSEPKVENRIAWEMTPASRW